jgi:hypothetical protein
MPVKVKAMPPTEQILHLFEDLRGRLAFEADRNKARRLARLILNAGYTPDDVMGCIRWANDHPKYTGYAWSLAFIGRRMPEYQAERERGRALRAQVTQTSKPPDTWPGL